MKLDRPRLLFALVAVLLSVLFVRLGVWQLERHRERAALNTERERRAAMPALALDGDSELARLPPPDSLAWRTVRLRGRWDPDHEFVLAPRSHGGRPAVELLTPLRLGSAAAVLVVRGWLPSPDARHADVRSARPDAEVAEVTGYVALPHHVPERTAEKGRFSVSRITIDGKELPVLRSVNLEIASDVLPYPIVQWYVISTESEPRAGTLRPLARPAPDSGPHLAYAIQWFAFALISLVGTGFLLRGEPSRRPVR